MRKRTKFAVAAGAALAVAGTGGAAAAPKLSPSEGSVHRGFGDTLHFGLDAAARYLGVTAAELRDALGSGRSLADLARGEGRPVGGLVDALVREQTGRLDQAVQQGNLNRGRRDEIASRLKDRVERMVEAQPLRGPSSFGPRHPMEEPPNAA